MNKIHHSSFTIHHFFVTKAIIVFAGLLFTLTLSASISTDAEKYYRAEQWAAADSLYAQLLKSNPGNRIYNHRYGVCLYEQRKDLPKAEKHLIKAKKSGIYLSAFYLGRVCFLEYKFEDAIAYYEFYVQHSNDKENIDSAKESLIHCQQGKTMLERTEDIRILDRVDVNKDEFYKHYKLSKEAGSFLSSAADIDEDSIVDNSPIYLTERGDRAFFAVEEDGNSNLYSKNRLLDHWSEKISLGDNINTDQDEAFPFLMSDGVMLYFSSKGHNSFGGYDIFATRYNASQNTYLPPQQLGMPFNSLGDDILFAIDEYNNIGWFASDRNSKEGEIAIYTFEPNATIQLLDTENNDERIKAAIISNATIDTIDTISPEQTTNTSQRTSIEEREIYFVVNDTLVYTSVNDFMSQDAQHRFLQYENTSALYDSVSAAVAEKRVLYSKTEDSNEKAQLISDIMKMEEQSFVLEEQCEKYRLTTRRLELETIRANNGYTKEKPVVTPVPVKEKESAEEHISPWETRPVTVEEETITPFFYNKTLYKYYDQVYTSTAVHKLVQANKMKKQAANKQFMADYIMREYNKPEPEEGFWNKVYDFDTIFTPALTQQEIIAKVNQLNKESVLLFVKANYISAFTLKGQNIILFESVNDVAFRETMNKMMERADFSFQQSNQKIYVSEGIYTNNKQALSQGNNFLIESIKMSELTTLNYLKFRYEQEQELKAEKPVPDSQIISEEQPDTISVSTPQLDTLVRTEIEPKTIQQEVLEVEQTAPESEIVSEQSDTVTEDISNKEPGVVVEPAIEAEITTGVAQEEYRIQFGIFSRILNEGDVDLSHLSYYKYPDKDLYKYFTGSYTNLMDASMGLEEIKAKGFKDAYVVKFVNGVPE